jgi:hypothetical protein
MRLMIAGLLATIALVNACAPIDYDPMEYRTWAEETMGKAECKYDGNCPAVKPAAADEEDEYRYNPLELFHSPFKTNPFKTE